MMYFLFYRIVISFNINHTVDAEDEPEIEEDATGKVQLGEMKSKPNFEVDLIRGIQTLSFTCSFLQGPPAEGEYSEFSITWNNYSTLFQLPPQKFHSF